MTYLRSRASLALGVTLAIGNVTGSTGSETFIVIGEVRDPSIENTKWDLIDVTNTQSSGRERRKGILDPGTLKLEGNRQPADAGQLAVEAAMAAQDPYDFLLQYPLNTEIPTPQTTIGDSYKFSALVTEFSLPNKTEGLQGWIMGLTLVNAAPAKTAGS